jgi:hypothetical protein
MVAVRLQTAPRVQGPARRPVLWSALGRGLAALVRGAGAVAFRRRRQHITVQPIRLLDAVAAKRTTDDGEIECVVADSLAALAALAPRFPPEFRDSGRKLQRRLAQGCVVSLARRRDDSAVSHVVGYELAERGVFSALGRRRPVSADVVFSHWAEVLPAYRGRRIHALLFATRDAYFGTRGAKIVVGVVSPKNRASLRALQRAGSLVAGSVERIELCGGALTWETPWEGIDRVLQAATATTRAAVVVDIPPATLAPAVSRTSEPSAPPLRLSSRETPR